MLIYLLNLFFENKICCKNQVIKKKIIIIAIPSTSYAKYYSPVYGSVKTPYLYIAFLIDSLKFKQFLANS